jgi:O-antigen/teichoic acid export membrane protein
MISSLSLLFKSVSWSIAYILIANGDGKKVLLSELIFLFVNLISSYFGFINYGLTGLAYSNVLIYVFHLFYMYSITSVHYKFNLEPSTIKLFFFVFICCMLIFIVNILIIQNLFFWIKYCLILFVCVLLAWKLSTLLKNK